MKKYLLIIPSILVLFCGCDSGTTIYLPAENVDGLHIGTPVTISGLQVGTLVDIALNQDRLVWLTLSIEEEFEIGHEAIFHLETTNILGAKTITIENSLAGNTINSGDSLSVPVNIKSLLDTYSTTIDSTEMEEISRKAGEVFDALMNALQQEH